MKWIIAERVTQPDQFEENDDGDLVPYVHWLRRLEEFPTRAEATNWLAGHQGEFELRRLEDGMAEVEG